MKDSFYDFRRIFQTYYNILWAYKFTSNILNNDEQDSLELDQY